MAQRGQGLSITLPRNFAFHSSDGLLPRTPEQSFAELSLPAPPHHSSCRFRRPRLDALTSSVTHDGTLPVLNASDIPIPSIEIAPSSDPFGPQSHSDHLMSSSSDDRFRLSAHRNIEPPRTPPAQIPSTPIEPNQHGAWDMQRPGSSCSIRSDSSVSSDGSYVSRPTSFGGSCTSPESDFQDPFGCPRAHYLESPTRPSRKMVQSLSDSSIATLSKTRWTPEMDAHLWNIYQMYLQDPTITPFKTVPGSLPPLGVCHRVAREAKRTWPKASKDQEERFRFVSPFAQPVEVSMTSPRSGSSTPTGAAPKIFWPKESSTRRRLKELCKRKFSIAPHYQRLLQSRSPSPFLDSFIRRPASRSSTLPPTEDTTMAFATRDLGVSLMSTSASGPLAQLAVETHEQMDSDDWFNDPITPQKSTPASSSLSQGHLEASGHLLPPSTLPKLASPFTYNTWGPTRSRRSQRPALNQFDTIHATGPHLLSPARLDPFTNAHKRRAQNQLDQELSPGGSDIQDNLQKLFSPTSSGDVSQRRVRLRNRGFTLGAADARERLDSLFTPPNDMSMTQFDEPSNKPAGLAPPALDDAKRLGSPFELDSKKSFRSHSRTPRHAASSSESFITKSFANSIAVPSIEGRLAAFQSAQQRSSSPTHPTFDPMEEGITDAERIRRQLLNRYQEA